jgi:hypothetical protein
MTEPVMKNPEVKSWGFVAPTSEERRNFSRYPFRSEILIKPLSSLTAIQARTVNLGRMGCFVETEHPLVLGSIVKISICTMTSTFEAEARVIHEGDGRGVALEFTSVDSKQMATLRVLLEMLKEECRFERFATRTG